MSSGSTRCAGCKHLRKKCPQDCILSPYFPPSNPQRFASVHEIFGASNVTKTLEQLPVHLRGDAAESMAYEAMQRMRDPVYGCAGIITQLQQQIIQVKGELSRAESEITRLIASAHHNQTPPLALGYGIHEQPFQVFNTEQDNQDDFIISDQHLPELLTKRRELAFYPPFYYLQNL